MMKLVLIVNIDIKRSQLSTNAVTHGSPFPAHNRDWSRSPAHAWVSMSSPGREPSLPLSSPANHARHP